MWEYHHRNLRGLDHWANIQVPLRVILSICANEDVEFTVFSQSLLVSEESGMGQSNESSCVEEHSYENVESGGLINFSLISFSPELRYVLKDDLEENISNGYPAS